MTNYRFSLRKQLLLTSLVLLLVPVVGYVGISQWVNLLSRNQQHNLQTSARLMAQVLVDTGRYNNRLHSIAMVEPIRPKKDLYAGHTPTAIVLDGKHNDWQQIKAIAYGKQQLVQIDHPYRKQSLTFNLSLATDYKSLYCLLQVKDNTVVYRDLKNITVHRNDHIKLSFVDLLGKPQHYIIAPRQPSNFEAHKLAANGRSIRYDRKINGAWRATDQGYNVEFKLPLTMLNGQFAIAVADVDDRDSRAVNFTMGTADTTDINTWGNISLPSKALSAQLSSFRQAAPHIDQIQLYDSYNQLIAESTSTMTKDSAIKRNAANENITSITNFTTTMTRLTISKLLPAQTSPGFDVTTPILFGGKQIARLQLQRSKATVREIHIQALQKPLYQSVLLLALGITIALVLASILNRRLKAFTTNMQLTVDAQGKVHPATDSAPNKQRQHPTKLYTKPNTKLNTKLNRATPLDEIQQISEGFIALSYRIQQYNHHLEAMAARLAHELRTPLSVIRTSLQNLNLQNPNIQNQGLKPIDANNQVYLDRADNGLDRLTNILNKMSEPTRLEQNLDEEDIEHFDLAMVVQGCVKGYKQIYPEKRFEIDIESQVISIMGIPDLIAQLLDKLIHNAVEFSKPNSAIKIRLTIQDDFAILRVINAGPELPDTGAAQLLDAMVSIPNTSTGSAAENFHLGLGLYIARIIVDFHDGHISLANRDDSQGVIVTIKLPLLRLSTKLR
ncbi:MAG: hypothetical protein KUG79_12265 [Pseudomonadales bacterium]|nr:hypothetical protein [Pseudomonadales bacterium]